MAHFILGSRGSLLAICQAKIVKTRLEELHPGHPIDIRTIKTQADRNPDMPLVAMGGEGVFVKELEAALNRGEIDAAVHSLKDVPLDIASGLRIGAVLEREDPRDSFISKQDMPFSELRDGACVGTSSLRRRSQLLLRRKDLKILEIRGNVDTRLRKLNEGPYEAIVVAACGLIRLGLKNRITEYLDFDCMLPEPGQGALSVEIRADDTKALGLISALEHSASRCAVEAERAFLRALGGGCRVPIAAYGVRRDGQLDLQGAVVATDGSAKIGGKIIGSETEPAAVGIRLAEQLISQGARDLLANTAKRQAQ